LTELSVGDFEKHAFDFLLSLFLELVVVLV